MRSLCEIYNTVNKIFLDRETESICFLIETLCVRALKAKVKS